MAKQLFANGASATLAVSISNSDTTVQVQSGYGALFPAPTGGNWFVLTLEDSSANIEVVKCTARSGDLLTVVRAQEGTLAQAFTNTVTRCELRDTRGTLEQFLQRSGDTLGGPLNLGGYALSNGSLGSDVTVPKTSIYVSGMIIMWSGSVGTIPTGWRLCDGTNGTPDLRGKFIIGAGDTYSSGASGGAASASLTTSAGGGHTHGDTGGTAITLSQIPSHTHRLYAQASGGAGDTESFANASAAVAGNANGTKAYTLNNAGGTQLVESAGGTSGTATPHTHTTTSVADHTHTATVDTVPPYYALCFIMFTG